MTRKNVYAVPKDFKPSDGLTVGDGDICAEVFSPKVTA
jgi:hypothetical protein